MVVKLVMNYSICTRYSTPRFEDVQQKLLQVDLIGWRLLFILQMIIIKEIDLSFDIENPLFIIHPFIYLSNLGLHNYPWTCEHINLQHNDDAAS